MSCKEINLKSHLPISSEESDRLFRLPISECIFYYLCCMENRKTIRKIKFYRKAREIINEYLDVSNLILLDQKIETLKIILLEYHEIELFESIYRHSFNKKIGIDLLPSRLIRKSFLEKEVRKINDS